MAVHLPDGATVLRHTDARGWASTGAPLARQLSDFGVGRNVLHVGLDCAAIPRAFPLHRQVIAREPLGEGNAGLKQACSALGGRV